MKLKSIDSCRKFEVNISTDHLKEHILPILRTLGYVNDGEDVIHMKLPGLEGVIPVQFMAKQIKEASVSRING